MSELTQKKCVSCEAGMAPFNRDESSKLLKQIKEWRLSGDARWISKEFKFDDFAKAMVFANQIADIAAEEGHHPDLQISWGTVIVELTTHAIRGLSQNDFIIAAKIDELQ